MISLKEPMAKIYGKCETCKKMKFFVKKRDFTLPTGLAVTSQKEMCPSCQVKITKALTQ